MKFSTRDLFWLTLVVALFLWLRWEWRDRRNFERFLIQRSESETMTPSGPGAGPPYTGYVINLWGRSEAEIWERETAD